MVTVWVGFIAFVLLMLALDLGVFHRSAHVVSVREALKWSGIWIAMGLTFSVFVYFAYEDHWFGLGLVADAVDDVINDGASAREKYLTGYLVEKSLSVDNIFVISIIFSAFAVPAISQHRVLFLGILGALVMRGVMISVGEYAPRLHRSRDVYRTGLIHMNGRVFDPRMGGFYRRIRLCRIPRTVRAGIGIRM